MHKYGCIISMCATIREGLTLLNRNKVVKQDNSRWWFAALVASSPISFSSKVRMLSTRHFIICLQAVNACLSASFFNKLTRRLSNHSYPVSRQEATLDVNKSRWHLIIGQRKISNITTSVMFTTFFSSVAVSLSFTGTNHRLWNTSLTNFCKKKK